jgi:hypothetical protein
MPGQVNPGYQFTLERFTDIEQFNESLGRAPAYVKNAYRILRKPPRYELYHLENDPHEFHNLATDHDYGSELNYLIRILEEWQESTDDPLRFEDNLKKLKSEVDSCWMTGEYVKKEKWYYPEYFFDGKRD